MARRRSGPTLIQRSRRVSAEQKAVFHHLTGAGKSKVRRPFFDLTPEDESVIVERLARGIDALLRESR